MGMSRASFRDSLPIYLAILCLSFATLAFGADTPWFSLVTSAAVCLFAAVCAIISARQSPSSFVLILLALWIIFAGASYIAGYTHGAEQHYLMSLAAIAMFWLGQQSSQGHRGIERAWTWLLMMGLAFAVFAFFQHMLDPYRIYGIPKPHHFVRLTGTFLNSNTTATFLGIIVLASIAGLYRRWLIVLAQSRSSGLGIVGSIIQSAWLPIITLVFAFTALLQTTSRAGISITALAAFLFVDLCLIQAMRDKKETGRHGLRSTLIFMTVLVIILVVFGLMSGDRVSERYGDVIADMGARGNIIKASWNGFLYKPLFGHGLGSFTEVKYLGMNAQTHWDTILQDSAHNIILQTLLQTGCTGLITLSLIYLAIIRRILRGLINSQRYSTYLAGIMCMTFLVIVHGLFDFALEIPAVMLLHVWVLGLGYGTQSKYVRG